MVRNGNRVGWQGNKGQVGSGVSAGRKPGRYPDITQTKKGDIVPPMSKATAQLIKSLLDSGWKVKHVNSNTVTLDPDPDQNNIYGAKR